MSDNLNTAMPENAPVQPPKKKANAKVIAAIVICVIAIAVLVVVLAVTGSIGSTETVTDADGDTVRSGKGTTEMSVVDTDGTVRTITTDRSLLTYDAILAEYTEVMNKLKTDAPGFTKTQYQNLPTEYQSLGSVGNIVLPIIEKYVTSKDAADADVYSANNAQKLPLYDSEYGCLLTNTAKIKNAYCEILEDGEYSIVITLIDEVNPTSLTAGAASTEGTINSIFAPYSAAEMITSITSLTGCSMDFNYTDCTVTLVYDSDTKQVSSVNMTMNIDVTLDAIIADFNARIVDITEFTDFVYQ
ncbi:MAG: hypothetical protein LUH40_04660 [Clostridiales bacterium]|nr:hypothetical protein [Clostridiales bacterium]